MAVICHFLSFCSHIFDSHEKEVQKKRTEVVESVVSGEYKSSKLSDRDSEVSPCEGKTLYVDGEVYNYPFMVNLDLMVVYATPPLSEVKNNGKVSQKKAISLGLKTRKVLEEKQQTNSML